MILVVDVTGRQDTGAGQAINKYIDRTQLRELQQDQDQGSRNTLLTLTGEQLCWQWAMTLNKVALDKKNGNSFKTQASCTI